MKVLPHLKNKKAGFLLVEIVLSIALFSMVLLVAGRMMMMQHKRMEHLRTVIAMQEILEKEKAKIVSGNQEDKDELQQGEFQIEREETYGRDEMGIPGLNSCRVTIKVQHMKTGWIKEIVVITLNSGSDL